MSDLTPEVKPKRVRATRKKTVPVATTPAPEEQLDRGLTNPETITDAPIPKKEEKVKPVVEEEETIDPSTFNKTNEDEVNIDDEPTDDELVDYITTQINVGKVGSPNYTINTKRSSVLATNPEGISHPPLAVWARNGRSLASLMSIADTRITEAQQGYGTAKPNDFRVLHLGEENNSTIELNAASFFARKGARWGNTLSRNGRNIKSGKINYKTTNQNSSDEQLEFVLLKNLGIGQPLSVRLWHSGLVFAMGIPDKEFRLSMIEQINTAHLETLRRTNGIIHGASSYYVNRILLQSFMKLVVDSNIDKVHWPKISTLIDHRDLQHIARALMQGCFIRGYNYTETCGGLKPVLDAENKEVIGENGKVKKIICGRVEHTVIDFGLIDAVDSESFTDWQADFIGRSLSAEKATLEDILQYQSQGKAHEPITVEINDVVSLNLKAPTVAKHIEIGEKWIESIEQSLRDTISADVDDATREDFINQRINSTSALDVSHWIESFSIDGQLHRSDKVIENFCRKLSNNEVLRMEIHEKIRKGIFERLGSAVAVPTERCPDCGTLSSEITDNGDEIYTIIDAVSRFFTLAAQNQ